MILIKHRVNQICDIPTSGSEFSGIEFDVRTFGADLVCSHDPVGDPFKNVSVERLLAQLSLRVRKSDRSNQLVIANLKEDGLESRITALVKTFGFSLMLLDAQLPTIIRNRIIPKDHFALRVSEYEQWNDMQPMKEFCGWVWIDTFHSIWYKEIDVQQWADLGFKLCLVSPELHCMGRIEDLFELKRWLLAHKKLALKIDAICTKYPEFWSSM